MSTLHRSNTSSIVTHHDNDIDRVSHGPANNEAETLNRQPQLQPLLARLVQRDHHEWERDNRHGKERDRRMKDGEWDHNTLPRGSGVVATNSHGVTTCHRNCDHYRFDNNGFA